MLKKKQKKIFGPSKKKISKINLVFGIILLLLGTILIFYVNYSNRGYEIISVKYILSMIKIINLKKYQ